MLKLTLRNLFARKLRLLMSGLSIVLGVAFLSGVLVFSHGLSSTFDGIINGSTPDGVVRTTGLDSFDGGVSGIGDSVLKPEVVAALEALPEVERADGSVDGFGLNLLAKDGTLVGGTGAPTLAFNYTATPNMDGDSALILQDGHWPEQPDEIVLDEGAAENGDYHVGDEVNLLAPFGTTDLKATLVGIAEFNGGGTAGATLVVFNTAGAQQIFLGGRDVFTSISLTAADGVSQKELADAAEGVLPDGFEAVTGDTVVEESETAIGSFLGIFTTILLAFAIIAVVVGGFIIVNTFTILIAQRTRELALLRALGADREQVTRSVLLEAAILGAIASTIGIAVGWALARGLAAIFRVIGLDIAGSFLTLTPTAILISYLVGIGVTVAAAYFPARRAGKVAPVAAMAASLVPELRSMSRRLAIAGIVLAIGALLVVLGFVGAPGPDVAYLGGGGVLWIITLAVISPVVGKPVLVVCRALFARLFGTTGRLAGENALRDPRRTGATAAALMIGLALVSTFGVLAASFNASVDDVVDEQFEADFLVQSSTFLPFTTAIGDDFEQVDGVAVVSRQQWVNAKIDGDDDKTVFIAGNDAAFADIYPLDVIHGTDRISGAEAIVSKSRADEEHWQVGDRFDLGFPAEKELHLTVAGIIEDSDVTSEITVPLDQLPKAGVQRQDSSLSVMLAPGADADRVHAELDDIVDVVPVVGVYDKAEFADSIHDQINQLLYMIYGMLALAVLIAVLGIVNTLGLSVTERVREIGLLRAVGMSRSNLRRMITLESVAISVLGAVLGMALGVVVGTLLCQSIDDVTSIGIPFAQLATFLVVAIVVGVLAAVLPSARASRMNVLEAIATE